MDYVETFNAVRSEFDEEMAILVTTALTINLTRNPSIEELSEKGLYTERVEEIIKQNLWEHADKVELVIKIWDALYDYQTRISLEGLGGCKVKTIKEIIAMNEKESA